MQRVLGTAVGCCGVVVAWSSDRDRKIFARHWVTTNDRDDVEPHVRGRAAALLSAWSAAYRSVLLMRRPA